MINQCRSILFVRACVQNPYNKKAGFVKKDRRTHYKRPPLISAIDWFDNDWPSRSATVNTIMILKNPSTQQHKSVRAADLVDDHYSRRSIESTTDLPEHLTKQSLIYRTCVVKEAQPALSYLSTRNGRVSSQAHNELVEFGKWNLHSSTANSRSYASWSHRSSWRLRSYPTSCRLAK